MLDDENIELYVSPEGKSETTDDALKREKKSRKHGLLNWLKLQVRILWIFFRQYCFLFSNLVS